MNQENFHKQISQRIKTEELGNQAMRENAIDSFSVDLDENEVPYRFRIPENSENNLTP